MAIRNTYNSQYYSANGVPKVGTMTKMPAGPTIIPIEVDLTKADNLTTAGDFVFLVPIPNGSRVVAFVKCHEDLDTDNSPALDMDLVARTYGQDYVYLNATDATDVVLINAGSEFQSAGTGLTHYINSARLADDFNGLVHVGLELVTAPATLSTAKFKGLLIID